LRVSALYLAVLFAGGLCVSTSRLCLGASPISPEQRRLNLQSFEYVWKTVRDTHWDPKLGGVDWRSAYDEFRPRVESAQTMEEARQLIAAMLDRLHQTHFGLIASDAYERIDDKAFENGRDHQTETRGQTGVEFRILAGHAIVTEAAAGSSAQEAGVRVGWELTRIDKDDVPTLIARIAAVSGQSRLMDLLASRALRARLDGPINSEAPVQFTDINGKVISLHLTRRVASGEITSFGFLPPTLVRFDAKKLPGREEYIRFNMFLKPDLVVTKFGDAIHECGHCPGVIIDLRGNPGGLGAMAMGVAGFLISQPGQKLGTMYMRTLPINFVIFPRAEVYQGPVAILVDGLTASTSEIFAGGLQDLKRARIFGERTAGAALPSHIERLPNGDGFQFAVANYVSESGRTLEGNGVTPDVETPLDRKALAEGRDPVLEAAVKWISSMSPAANEAVNQ
jgi:carboxyl-terminal processing protease